MRQVRGPGFCGGGGGGRDARLRRCSKGGSRAAAATPPHPAFCWPVQPVASRSLHPGAQGGWRCAFRSCQAGAARRPPRRSTTRCCLPPPPPARTSARQPTSLDMQFREISWPVSMVSGCRQPRLRTQYRLRGSRAPALASLLRPPDAVAAPAPARLPTCRGARPQHLHPLSPAVCQPAARPGRPDGGQRAVQRAQRAAAARGRRGGGGAVELEAQRAGRGNRPGGHGGAASPSPVARLPRHIAGWGSSQ
jgi:hypothetical protein